MDGVGREEPLTGNLISDLIRRHRSKKGLHEMKESHSPVAAHKMPYKSLTDVHTSDDCNNSSSESNSCLQLRVLHLTEENKSLREELERSRHEATLNLCNGKLLKLLEETECLAKEVEDLRKKLDQANVEKDFYMRAYNNIKKDNETLVKELTHRRKEMEGLKTELRAKDHSLNTLRKRTSSQSPKHLASFKSRESKAEEESLQDIIATLKGEVEKASSFRNLEETLRKLESKLEGERKSEIKDSGKRKEYFGDFRPWESKYFKK